VVNIIVKTGERINRSIPDIHSEEGEISLEDTDLRYRGERSKDPSSQFAEAPAAI